MSDTIILTRMYVGTYLQNNIGHEVINLFKADNGNNYIFINKDGRINPKYEIDPKNDKSISAVILTRYVEKGVMEVIAKAEELKQILYKSESVSKESQSQITYVEENNVKYAGVYLYKIYGNTDAEKIVITFKANKLLKVSKPVYLIEDQEKMASYDNAVYLPEKHFSKQSLRMYYSKDEFPQDYDELHKLLHSKDKWEESNTTEKVDLSSAEGMRQNNSFLSVIKQEYDELVFSNLFAYYFEQNRSVFSDFAKEILGIDDFTSNFKITRESKNNIDLWIEDPNTVIVIENKIKSKINGEQHDIHGEKVQSQLSKYYEFALSNCSGKKVCCYIFAPDYNNIDIEKYSTGKHYRIIKYSQIYDFYMKYAGRMLHTDYFAEFVDALHLHTTTIDNSNYEVMKSRFFSRIRRILENKDI